MGQAGAARAEVVQRNRDAHGPELFKHGSGLRRVAHRRGFGAFEHQPAGAEPVAALAIAEADQQRVPPQHAGRDSDGDPRRTQAGAVPLADLPADLIEQPVRSRVHGAVALGRAPGRIRQRQARYRTPTAQQGLSPGEAASVGGERGREMHARLSAARFSAVPPLVVSAARFCMASQLLSPIGLCGKDSTPQGRARYPRARRPALRVCVQCRPRAVTASVMPAAREGHVGGFADRESASGLPRGRGKSSGRSRGCGGRPAVPPGAAPAPRAGAEAARP